MQDGLSGHWWLKVDHQNIGYWPKHIFTLLTNDARYFEFGGEVYRNINKPCPPMGNGRFPNNNMTQVIFHKRNMSLEYNIRDTESAIMDTYTSNAGYKVVNWGNQGGNMRKVITYGGPGGNCD